MELERSAGGRAIRAVSEASATSAAGGGVRATPGNLLALPREAKLDLLRVLARSPPESIAAWHTGRVRRHTSNESEARS